jgi:hypothetical protein
MRFAFIFSVLMPAFALALPAATNGDNTQVEARQVTFSNRQAWSEAELHWNHTLTTL